jgi:hypothetical protein
MDQKTLYLEIYKLLEQVTPLKKDCGNLCNKACCQGIDNESGMYLFPGEEELPYSADFIIINPVTSQDHSRLIAICKGVCDRKKRPLACRIFPLTPYVTLKEILTIVMDPRARYLCPLARSLKRSELNPEFVTKVRQAFQLLMADAIIKEFIRVQSRLLDEFIEIQSQFS